MPKHIHGKMNSCEYQGIHMNSLVSLREIIFCYSLIGHLYLWAPTLCILLLYGFYTPNTIINPNSLMQVQID